MHPASDSDIVLGQTDDSFAKPGYGDTTSWSVEGAPGRRRKWLWDGGRTLAAQIASASDLDDLIPSIVALQIELTKIHRIIRKDRELAGLIADAAKATREGDPLDPADVARCGELLLLSPEDWLRLQVVWGTDVWANLAMLIRERKRYSLRMLGGTYVGYTRSTRRWWLPAQAHLVEHGLAERPVYFVSSNTHSLVNTLSGTAQRRKEALTDYVRTAGNSELLPELAALEAGRSRSSWENLLYFAARSFFSEPGMEAERERRSQEERERGMVHISSNGAVDVGIQIIDLSRLDPAVSIPRLLGDRRDHRSISHRRHHHQHQLPARSGRLSHHEPDRDVDRPVARYLCPWQSGHPQWPYR